MKAIPNWRQAFLFFSATAFLASSADAQVVSGVLEETPAEQRDETDEETIPRFDEAETQTDAETGFNVPGLEAMPLGDEAVEIPEELVPDEPTEDTADEEVAAEAEV